ncbi:MAG: putative ABC transporter ATP-binding protein [Verrucomicrobiae bacterium]|nr:putative ABC transporter ATP-binding protein [Verrucomicrobiae bacterium]
MQRRAVRYGDPMTRHDTVNDETMISRKRGAWEVFTRVFAYLRRYPWFGLGMMVCAVLTTLAGLAFPKLIQMMIDEFLHQRRLAEVYWLSGALLAACLLQNIFNFLRIQLNNRFEQRVIFDMRCDLYDKLQRLSVQYFDQRASGDLMTRVIDDVNAVERILIDGIEQGTTALLALFGVGYMMFVFSPTLTLWSFIPFPLLLAGALIYTMTAHNRYRAQRVAASGLNALLLDNLQGIRQIKGYGREPHESGRFGTKANDLRRATMRVMNAWSIYSPAMEFSAWIGYVVVFWIGGAAVLRGELTVGAFAGFLAYIGMFYSPVRQLHGLNQMFQAARAAGERVFDILDAPVEIGERPDATVLPARVAGAVEYRGVGFEYRSDLPVLRDVNIHARPGETIALVGPTGAGKTTVVNLLPRFYEATRGAVLIDGHDIRDLTLESLRQQIGIVSQEAFLFNGTIRENILYGRLDATETEMMEAAKAANCHEFIMRLPEKYDARVGERGVKLSVGEKQRVSIARALLKDPPILILDEATASVDTATEKLIQEALDRLMAHRTSFVIAHRLSTVRKADQILVLKNGQISERGSHAELMRLNGLYAQLCRVQSTAATIEECMEEMETA